MFKNIAAIALSGVIALTSLTPTMAEANGHNRTNISQDELIGGLIFGAIALYALSEASKDNKAKPVRPPKPKPPHYGNKPGNGHGHHANKRKKLPTACLRKTSNTKGPKQFFGRQCLRENFGGYNRLPRACFSEFRTTRGWRVGFGPRCLRNNGYRW